MNPAGFRVCTLEIWRGKGAREIYTYTAVRDAVTGELLMSASLNDAMEAGIKRNYLYHIVPRGDQKACDNIKARLTAVAGCALQHDDLPSPCGKCGATRDGHNGWCIEGT